MKTFLLLVTVSVVTAAAQAARVKKPLLLDGLFEGDKFTPVEDFTDEFRGSFNHDKWYDMNPRWLGRQPGLFAAKNVKQKRGRLFLKGRYEGRNSNAFDGAPEGYETYTTSFVQTKKSVKFGYFEVSAKPSNSRLSSSFWASLDTPTLWTEIDVFELGGAAVREGIDFRRRINMNLHVFRNEKKGIEPGVNEISKPTYYTHTSFLRSKFNTYGLDWSKKHITWTFNGRAIRRDRNRLWRQALPLKLDVETMPFWFGLPSRRTLPATYKIKYIRAWSRELTAQSTSVRQDTLPGVSARQFGNMFGLNTPTNVEDGDDDEEEGDDDSAELEVHETERETNAPRDGLQRPPIPGSNEAVYRPVMPFGSSSWGAAIAAQDAVMDDVFGAQLVSGEQVNLADFDEELTFFGGGASTPAPVGQEGESGAAGASAATPGDEAGAAAGVPEDEGKDAGGAFGGLLGSFPWL